MSRTDRRLGIAGRTLDAQGQNNAPMMALFGGIFALLLVFFLIVNLLSEISLRERLEQAGSEGLFRINQVNGTDGYVIITLPEALRIVETNRGVSRGRICQPGGVFPDYAHTVYTERKNLLIFMILEGSISTMAEARDCLRQLLPGRRVHIGWLMADNEFLKSVALDDVPSYIEEYAH